MPARNPAKRTAVVKANLTPAVYDRLKLLAERQGQTAAVLASVAIGQYVNAHLAAHDVQKEMAARALELLERMPQQLLDLEAKKS